MHARRIFFLRVCTIPEEKKFLRACTWHAPRKNFISSCVQEMKRLRFRCDSASELAPSALAVRDQGKGPEKNWFRSAKSIFSGPRRRNLITGELIIKTPLKVQIREIWRGVFIISRYRDLKTCRWVFIISSSQKLWEGGFYYFYAKLSQFTL